MNTAIYKKENKNTRQKTVLKSNNWDFMLLFYIDYYIELFQLNLSLVNKRLLYKEKSSAAANSTQSKLIFDWLLCFTVERPINMDDSQSIVNIKQSSSSTVSFQIIFGFLSISIVNIDFELFCCWLLLLLPLVIILCCFVNIIIFFSALYLWTITN